MSPGPWRTAQVWPWFALRMVSQCCREVLRGFFRGRALCAPVRVGRPGASEDRLEGGAPRPSGGLEGVLVVCVVPWRLQHAHAADVSLGGGIVMPRVAMGRLMDAAEPALVLLRRRLGWVGTLMVRVVRGRSGARRRMNITEPAQGP